MLIKSAQQITQISDDPSINSQNYMELIAYINNLYDIINILKPVISIHDSVFLPTFKGKYTCAKYGIDSISKENELKVFAIDITSVLEDFNEYKKEMLFDILSPICENDSIHFDGETIKFVLL